MYREVRLTSAAVLALVVLIGGCGNQSESTAPAGLKIELDKKGERELLSFYFGGYVPGTPADPFSTGLLVESDNEYFLPDSIVSSPLGRHVRELVETAGDDQLLDWDEFEAFILETWPAVRGAPETVASARMRYGNWSDTGKWFTMEVTGSMSPYRRRITIELSALRSAVDGLGSLDDPVLYPNGTVFVGEHLRPGTRPDEVVETTFMVKRVDGYWDYFAYGADGAWTRTIENDPSDLNVPTQCIGCHVGNRSFEPERSFPAEARPGPTGPRLVHVDSGLNTAGIVERLNEHVRRSDTILGLYATLYLAKIRSSEPGTLDAWERSTRARLLSNP